jgi:hypothetical protein
MCYWILKENGKVVARSTVQPLTEEELHDENEKARRFEFDKSVQGIIGGYEDLSLLDDEDFCNDELELPIEDTSEAVDDVKLRHEVKDDLVSGPDPFIGAKVYMPHGDQTEIAKVLGCKRGPDGNYIGRAHANPILDSRQFIIEFPDGEQQDIAYNMLAEHLFSQVDEEGNQYRMFKAIIGHRRKKDAVDKADQYTVHKNGKQVKKKTLRGWDMELEWMDGSTSFLPLKTVKETNMVEVAEYAVANRIDDEPTFDWWVKDCLKQKKRLIGLSWKHHIQHGYKFGICIPESVEDALQLDKINGDAQWYDAMIKEMQNVCVAFDIKDHATKPPPGYEYVDLMMVYDIKMDYTWKARLCARGDQTEPPKEITYSSVVSRESIRIAFTYAAMLDLDIRIADVGNAYLYAPTNEHLYTICGPEFGEDEGKIAIIVRALYGLKGSGAAYS